MSTGSGGPAVRGAEVSRRGLLARLDGAARVTQISAPAGSGKTSLLRAWIGEAGLADSVAWVSVHSEDSGPQRFWVTVADALRATAEGANLVRPLTAAPDLDGWTIVELLLKDLALLADRIWLIFDDVHELGPAEAERQLELLVMRAPPQLRFVLVTRYDLRLGLHRLRLEGELTEIRAADMSFTLDEARALFQGAGIELPDAALAVLCERAEGWAAGLRLAALSMAGHPDPERLAAEFCGSERTVAEYLLAEVLDRQSEPIRRLLLRTSVLDRVNGELADLLTGGTGGEAILQDLEEAGAFVMSTDAARSWFRYHRLFADLLRLELRCTAPGEVTGLHRAAAGWFARHGHPVEAVRHAQAAQDWGLAARLLADHSLGLNLDGRGCTVHELLAGFPAGAATADAELAAQLAVDEVFRGSLGAAEQYLALSASLALSVPANRQSRFQLELANLRMAVAERHGDLPAAVKEAQTLLAEETGEDDLRAVALIRLGIAELWAPRPQQAQQHLEQGTALAQRIGRPWLEVSGLAHWAMCARFGSHAAIESGTRAIELARCHGWTEDPVAGVAHLALAVVKVWRGQLAEAEPLLNHAERALRPEAQPAATLVLHAVRGGHEFARGRYAAARTAFLAAEKTGNLLVPSHPLVIQTRAFLLRTLVRLGETDRAEAILAAMREPERESGHMRIALAVLRLTRGDPRAATAALAPVLDGSNPVAQPVWLVEALLLEAITRAALSDHDAASSALERALDLTEPDRAVLPFLFHPAPELLELHATQRTAHAALIGEILSRLAGETPASPSETPAVWPQPLLAPVSKSELRVLRYLPTRLSAQEIAGELDVSSNTVKTHMRTLYAKLGAHSRAEAIDRARALSLLASSTRRGLPQASGVRRAVRRQRAAASPLESVRCQRIPLVDCCRTALRTGREMFVPSVIGH